MLNSVDSRKNYNFFNLSIVAIGYRKYNIYYMFECNFRPVYCIYFGRNTKITVLKICVPIVYI
jgi:hypothetical protein